MEIFFKDTDELRRYVQGVDGSMSMETLKPAFMVARKAVADTVGDKVFDALVDIADEPVFQAMRFAMANYAMYKHLIFWSVSRGGDPPHGSQGKRNNRQAHSRRYGRKGLQEHVPRN